MAKDQSHDRKQVQSNPHALSAFEMPRMDLVGPTVADDIRRAIWRYGADAVKEAVREATKQKRGRKRLPDWPELREIIEADARSWLAGQDPFAERSNYAIAKEFAERNPGHSVVSTHKRIERKLSRGPYDRRWFTLVSAKDQSEDGPYGPHIRTLQALSELPESAELWQVIYNRARSTIADYEAREGKPPPAQMTYKQIEEAVRMAELMSGRPKPPRGGLFSQWPVGSAFSGTVLDDAEEPEGE